MISNKKLYILIGALYLSLGLALLQTFGNLKDYIQLIVFILNVLASIFAIIDFLTRKK